MGQYVALISPGYNMSYFIDKLSNTDLGHIICGGQAAEEPGGQA